MACGEPSPSCLKTMQITVCQICGQDLNSCTENAVNYQKQVDPPVKLYTQLLPDSRYDFDEENTKRMKGKHLRSKPCPPVQLCIPLQVISGKNAHQQQANSEKLTPVSNAKIEDTGAKEQSKENAGTDPSTTLKASCFPTGGGSCPPPIKMMLCLPCPPPEQVNASAGSSSTPCRQSKPSDYTYRCESRELRGGNLYQCCQCLKRNGLQHDCPRTPCQGRPACLTKPWPNCWPSGGCHGIDFTREKGTKRVNPCLQQRFDKKECNPPGDAGSRSQQCSGNMMVVVCPPPSQN